MVRLIDLPVLLIVVGLFLLLIWLGGVFGITGPMLTQFFNSIPNWLELAVIILVLGSVVAASIYIWQKILAKMGIDS